MSDHESLVLPPSVEDLIEIFILQEQDAFTSVLPKSTRHLVRRLIMNRAIEKTREHDEFYVEDQNMDLFDTEQAVRFFSYISWYDPIWTRNFLSLSIPLFVAAAQAFTDAKLLQRVKDEWTQNDSDIIHDLASGATGLLATSLSLRDVQLRSYEARNFVEQWQSGLDGISIGSVYPILSLHGPLGPAPAIGVALLSGFAAMSYLLYKMITISNTEDKIKALFQELANDEDARASFWSVLDD